jgi:hypothetical protein
MRGPLKVLASSDANSKTRDLVKLGRRSNGQCFTNPAGDPDQHDPRRTMLCNQLTRSSGRRDRTKSTQLQRATELPKLRLQKRFENLPLCRSRHEDEYVGHEICNTMIEIGGRN